MNQNQDYLMFHLIILTIEYYNRCSSIDYYKKNSVEKQYIIVKKQINTVKIFFIFCIKNKFMAEREGFEPPFRVSESRFSRPVYSTTLPSFQKMIHIKAIVSKHMYLAMTIYVRLHIFTSAFTYGSIYAYRLRIEALALLNHLFLFNR